MQDDIQKLQQEIIYLKAKAFDALEAAQSMNKIINDLIQAAGVNSLEELEKAIKKGAEQQEAA